jgi:hypothetical protein
LKYDLRRCFLSCAPSKNCVGGIRPKTAEDINLGLTRCMEVPAVPSVVAELDSSCPSKRSRPAKLELDDIYVQPVKRLRCDNELEHLL